MPAATEAIVGREQELAALEAVVGRGDGGVVIVGGAGIGKTTVWSHAVRVADDFGFRVLRARPAGAESGLPFGVLGDLFADVAEDVLDGERAPRLRARRTRTIEQGGGGRALRDGAHRRSASL
jgi:hypothetical protein